jgi:hypothetical protein
MEIQKIYTDILAFAGKKVDDQGQVYALVNEDKQYTMVKGLPVVLPTDAQLRSGNLKEKVIFHPLSENILNQGEPDTVVMLRKCINIRLNYSFGIIAQSLLRLAASPKLHQQLSPDQTELLVVLKDADATMLKHWSELIQKVFIQKKSFVDIYVRYGGTYKGQRYFRVGVTSFPVYEELKAEKGALFGVNLRNKDRLTLRELYRFILPGIDLPEQYSFGSNSNVAPYLEALMHSAMNVAGRFNATMEQYQDYMIDESAGVTMDMLRFSADWVEAFENLDGLLPLIRRIPPQLGNDAPTTAAPAPAPAAPSYPVPAPPPSMPMPMAAPMPGAAPTATDLQYTSRGLDFNSLVRNKPQLAMAANPFAPAMPAWGPPQMPQMPPYAGGLYNPQAQAAYPPPGYPQAPGYPPQMAQMPGMVQPYPQPGMYGAQGYPNPPPPYPPNVPRNV